MRTATATTTGISRTSDAVAYCHRRISEPFNFLLEADAVAVGGRLLSYFQLPYASQVLASYYFPRHMRKP